MLLANVLLFLQVLVSCLMLLTIALERYISIVCPLKHHSMLNKRNAMLIIVMCWIYGLVIGSLPLLGWNSIDVFNTKNIQLVDYSPCGATMNCSQAVNTSEQAPVFRCLYQNVISGTLYFPWFTYSSLLSHP